MASVFDVAKYILNKTGEISAWKLQKLCYYSQAWSTAWTESPLYPEETEAWENGPVCRALFDVHKGRYMLQSGDIKRGDLSALDADQTDTIDRVLAYYGDWEPYELREQTHSEAPWKNARHGVPSGAPSNAVITTDSMGEYYGSL